MKRTLILCLLLTLCSCQDNNLLIGGWSKHSGTSGLNENQRLMGWEGTNKWGKWRRGGTFSHFKNSFRKESNYMGAVIKRCTNDKADYCIGLTAGAATGYKEAYGSEVVPFGGIMGDAKIWRDFGVYGLVIPYTPEGVVGLVGFKYKFNTGDKK